MIFHDFYNLKKLHGFIQKIMPIITKKIEIKMKNTKKKVSANDPFKSEIRKK